MSNTTIVIPAYGRQYDNITKATKDWQNGKDFKIANGPYCSIRDFGIFDSVMLVTPDFEMYLKYGAI